MKCLGILLVALAVLAAGGCGSGLYDEKDVYSSREHLSEFFKGGDLLQSLEKEDVAKTVLVGAYNSTFNPNEPTDWNSAELNNQVLLDALSRVGNKIWVFPLLRGDEPALLQTAAKAFENGAKGFYLANGLPNQRRCSLDDPRLHALYAWCDIRHIPILVDVDLRAYGAEFENVVREYPSLTFIGGRLLGLVDDLPALGLIMQRRRNLYLDFSFAGDEQKAHACETISRQVKEYRAFIEKYYDRVLWGTQMLVSRAPGRNVDWLTQYVADSRHFLEKPSVKMKFLLRNKPTLIKLAGLDLARRELGHLYHLNIRRAIDDQASPTAPSDLNKLLVSLPPGAENVKGSEYRLLVACVTSPRNPVEGLFSARLKNAITGSLTSWREMTGVDAPMEIVTVPPLDRWLPDIFALERLGRVEVLPGLAAVQQRLTERPLTLALIPFGDVPAGLRVLSIDGENPAIPYIRDCARRGGPALKNYFNNYPLLIPVAAPQEPPPALSFEPHELRRITLAAQILPREIPAAVKGDTEVDPVTKPLYKIASLLQSSDLSMIAAAAPFAENCAAGSPTCTDARWLNALDDLGVGGVAFPAPADAVAAWDESGRRLAAHGVQPARADERTSAAFSLRGLPFAVLAEDARGDRWSQAAAEKRVADAARSGANVFVYLYAGRGERPVAAARALAAAGAVAVIVVDDQPPQPIEWRAGRLIAYGLGNPTAGAATGGPASTVLCEFTYYGDRLISTELFGAEMQGGRMDFLHTVNLTHLFQTIFPGR